MSAQRGVLLVNLGTPEAPRPKEVRRYLREFLSDPRVIDIPALPRRLLLELVILPTRPRASAAAYAKIWTEAGSPLLIHGRGLRDGVADALGESFHVALGMRYGRPSIGEALEELDAAGVDELLVLPLFPQYASAATGSALECLYSDSRAARFTRVNVLGPFFDEPEFIGSWTEVARPVLDPFAPDHVLMSYHGLPERQVTATDPTGAHCLAREDCCDAFVAANRHCYRAQCFATSRALAASLDLAADRVSTSFQSRLGRTPWIRPYTDFVLPELAQRGVKRIAVMCPTFVADCLETLEEIGIRAEEQWREVGGEALCLVPSLNAHPSWVTTVSGWVRRAFA